MSSIPQEEEMLVARAIRQAFETEANPGNAVSGPIPHMIQSQGTFNLHRAAQIVLDALSRHRAHKADLAAKQLAKEMAEAKEQALKVSVTEAAKPEKPALLQTGTAASAVTVTSITTSETVVTPPVVKPGSEDLS